MNDILRTFTQKAFSMRQHLIKDKQRDVFDGQDENGSSSNPEE